LTPYVPKGITGYDDDDDDVNATYISSGTEDRGHPQGKGKFVRAQAMKAYRGSRSIAVLLNLDTSWW